MGYMTHNPYKGRPYVPDEAGNDVNGYEGFTAFCDECCPEAQRFPTALREAWDETTRAIQADNLARHGHAWTASTVDTPRDLVDAAEAAGAAFLAHDRYGWAPTVGRACAKCGSPA